MLVKKITVAALVVPLVICAVACGIIIAAAAAIADEL